MRDLVRKLSAHAAGADHRRRGARTGGLRLLQAMNPGHDWLDGDPYTPTRLPPRPMSRIEIDDHHGRLHAAVEDAEGDDHDLDRQSSSRRPGLPTAPAKITHITEGDGHGRRRYHHPGPSSLMRSKARTPAAASSAVTARPGSAGRGSGSGRATSTRRAASPRRSTRPTPRKRSRSAHDFPEA